MRVAGFGFRKGAGVESLRAAFEAAGGASGVDMIATAETKIEALTGLVNDWGLEIVSVPVAALADQPVMTQSAKSARMFGTGSLSEAAALWGAGEGAVLVARRAISPDHMATCAIAKGAGR